MRREVPLIITFVVGFLMIVSYYVPHEPINQLQDWATKIVLIIVAFALIMGSLNLNKINIEKVTRKRPGWGFSVVLLVGFWSMWIMGVFHPVLYKWFPGLPEKALDVGSPYMWGFLNVQYHLAASMFSMLAFFVASASYRAFRARTPEATLLLLAAFLVMLGRVPIGDVIPIWIIFIILIGTSAYVAYQYFKDKTGSGFANLLALVVAALVTWMFIALYNSAGVTKMSTVADWIMDYPNTAGQRAILLGIAIGYISTSLRIILGIERSFVGGE